MGPPTTRSGATFTAEQLEALQAQITERQRAIEDRETNVIDIENRIKEKEKRLEIEQEQRMELARENEKLRAEIARRKEEIISGANTETIQAARAPPLSPSPVPTHEVTADVTPGNTPRRVNSTDNTLLVEQVLALQHQLNILQNRNHSAPDPYISIRDAIQTIPPFDGDTNRLTTFLQACWKARELVSPANERILVRTLKHKLTGRAYQIIARDDFDTVLELSDKLSSLFSSLKTTNHYRGDLANIYKKPSEHVMDYIIRVKTLKDAILDSERRNGYYTRELIYNTELEASESLKQGLPTLFRNSLILLNPTDFEDTCTKAIIIGKQMEDEATRDRQRQRPQSNYVARPPICQKCNRAGHTTDECTIGTNRISNYYRETPPERDRQFDRRNDRDRQPERRDERPNVGFQRPEPNYGNRPILTCTYCKNLGHTIDECRKKRYNEESRQADRPAPEWSTSTPHTRGERSDAGGHPVVLLHNAGLGDVPAIRITSPDLATPANFLIDTGAEPNIIKYKNICNPAGIDGSIKLAIKGITEDLVHTLGQIVLNISGIPVVFHVVENSFNVTQDGILGSAFFAKTGAVIDYKGNRLQLENSVFHFLGSTYKLEARAKQIVKIKISNPENLEAGYIPELQLPQGIYAGQAICKVIGDHAILPVINTRETGTDLELPVIRIRSFLEPPQGNEKTIGDAYPLPNITDILDQLGSAKYFSVFDLASGFHQIKMAREDAEKTAFSTPFGHYQFERMPFGLKNAPATFQRLMDRVLTGLQGIEMFVYLDDIVIYASSLHEHTRKFNLLIDRLRSANLKLQPDKCEFLRKEVNYLGHIISEEGLKPDPKKLDAVKNFPIPKNPKNVKQFLGLAGYYRRFIQNFSKIAKPLTELLKKDKNFNWTEKQANAFAILRDKLCEKPILQYPDFNKPFIVTTDASGTAVGAVLSQGQIGQDLPIAYTSRLLNKAEQNYSTTEKVLLAMVYAVKHFRPYLYGKTFTLVTDHRPLTWLQSLKDPSSRLARWKVHLMDYQFNIQYKPGRINANADALSRNPVVDETFARVLQITEEIGDLFSAPTDYALAHCVSEDFKMGAGIAKKFAETFQNRELLLQQQIKIGGVARLKVKNRNIFYLVTKTKYYEKPTYKTVETALRTLRKACEKEKIYKIAMPQIGCGLDGLNWGRVKGLISTILPAPFLVKIYKLSEEELSESDDGIFETPQPSDREVTCEETPQKQETPQPTPKEELKSKTPCNSIDESEIEEYYSVDNVNSGTTDTQETQDETSEDSDSDDEIFSNEEGIPRPNEETPYEEVRDRLSMHKGNCVFFITQRGEPLDEGAKDLENTKKLPEFTHINLARAKVHQVGNRYFIGLPIKEGIKTQLDNEVFDETITSLQNVITELNLTEIGIAKTIRIDNLCWKEIIRKLKIQLVDIRCKVTVYQQLVKLASEQEIPSIIQENHESSVGGHTQELGNDTFGQG
ncbi:uncharacterized protein LOC125502056 [Athalia rosae]|uniref:uncharacterized protein LOC125502056 n=1 Tax=Athalia rosae TaxID=37344 RepID=UPI0020346830|nr:uncharacterized protein LOC125502056 [Athalia rosae]